MNHLYLTISILLASLTGFLHANESILLEDFKGGKSKLNWQTVNDGVMGGLSKGRPIMQPSSTMNFKGEISLENNGGFSSIRTFGDQRDLSDYKGVELRLKGDGRTYYLTSRNAGKGRLAFWSPITPVKGEWQTIRIPFSSFYATWFGKKVPVVKFSASKVTSVGFMLYDKKAGVFDLEVDWVKAYR